MARLKKYHKNLLNIDIPYRYLVMKAFLDEPIALPMISNNQFTLSMSFWCRIEASISMCRVLLEMMGFKYYVFLDLHNNPKKEAILKNKPRGTDIRISEIPKCKEIVLGYRKQKLIKVLDAPKGKVLSTISRIEYTQLLKIYKGAEKSVLHFTKTNPGKRGYDHSKVEEILKPAIATIEKLLQVLVYDPHGNNIKDIAANHHLVAWRKQADIKYLIVS